MNLIVYGLGSTGQVIVDELLDSNVAIDLILDRGKAGQCYRDIPILALEGLEAGRLSGAKILIALHNHYVDFRQLHDQLVAAGAADVLTPIRLGELIDRPKVRPGYWLDPAFPYDAHNANFARVRSLLADSKSRELYDAILRYRRGGNVADCPVPSLDDEYAPNDLPRFAVPLRLIDCGAFTGVAIHKLLKADYAIDSFVAFEPDAANFAILAARNFPVGRALCLPLGTWSTTTQLNFSSGGAMASRLSDDGDTMIQCVAVDDVLHGEPFNLVKLDVEGAEIETLKGMQRIIREQRPNLLVSAYHTPGHLHEIAELIDDWRLGYRFHLRVHEHNSFGVVLYALQDESIEL